MADAVSLSGRGEWVYLNVRKSTKNFPVGQASEVRRRLVGKPSEC